LDKAEEMFRKYMEWREENDIDNALSWDIPQDMRDNFPYRVTGLTQNGGLVICVNVGDWDPAFTRGRYDDLMKCAFHELEYLTQFARYFSMQRNSFSKLVGIIDLSGLTFAHCTQVEWIKALITLLKAFEAYYPESLKRAYLLSAPWVFSILWAITKPFISTATHQRLRFLGSDRDTWRAEISQVVDEDQFPESFGGLLPEDYQLVLDEDGTVQGMRMGETSNEKNNQNQTDPQEPKPVDSIDLD